VPSGATETPALADGASHTTLPFIRSKCPVPSRTFRINTIKLVRWLF
jgi:hypothetical protein